MERNPKKSKALIISIIAILLLLIAGYFIFKNSDKIFGTKGSTNISKIFAPLLGSSKQKDVANINTTDTTTGDNTSTTGTGNTSTNGSPLNTTGNNTPINNNPPIGNNSIITPGSGVSAILPPFNPIPTPGSTPATGCKDKNGKTIPCTTNDLPPPPLETQCSDGVDNDADKLMDTNDPGCHSDYDQNNNLSYDTNINDESRKKDNTATAIGGLCPDDPLIFTEEEKAQLAVLLRQYYLLAPTLRIEDDITLLDYDNQTNEELVKQATILINDCKVQKANPSYTGPQEIKDNPYYQSPITAVTVTGNNVRPEYLPGYGLWEMLLNIW
mgnify:FL=1